MRTTIDLPDDMLRRAKAQAALNGMKLKDYIRLALERILAGPEADPKPKLGHDFPIPVAIPASRLKVNFSTNAEINEAFSKEDAERYG